MHRNIPIFIPHLGCPNQCVFCDQNRISGQNGFREADVEKEIRRALSAAAPDRETEIAFFGGSFTCIDRDLMIRLLETASSFVREGLASGIRLSTRPDGISPEILGILSRYPVREIELGLQSMDDRVLELCRRGHTAAQGRGACRAVTGAGFRLTGQMMIGLPGASPASECMTAEEIAELGAVSARIYPTVVFAGTPLEAMVNAGTYRPITVSEAVTRSADVLRIFREKGITCLRIGLCASEDLTSPETAVAGANHPAIGELVWNELYYDDLTALLRAENLLGKTVELTVPAREVSKIVGQRRINLIRLKNETGTTVTRVTGDKETDRIRAALRQET